MKPTKKLQNKLQAIKATTQRATTHTHTHETMSQKIEQAIFYRHVSIGFAPHNMDIVRRGVAKDSAMMHKTQHVHKMRHIKHRAHEPHMQRNTTTNIVLIRVVFRPGGAGCAFSQYAWLVRFFFVVIIIMAYVVSMIYDIGDKIFIYSFLYP